MLRRNFSVCCYCLLYQVLFNKKKLQAWALTVIHVYLKCNEPNNWIVKLFRVLLFYWRIYLKISICLERGNLFTFLTSWNSLWFKLIQLHTVLMHLCLFLKVSVNAVKPAVFMAIVVPPEYHSNYIELNSRFFFGNCQVKHIFIIKEKQYLNTHS